MEICKYLSQSEIILDFYSTLSENLLKCKIYYYWNEVFLDLLYFLDQYSSNFTQFFFEELLLLVYILFHAAFLFIGNSLESSIISENLLKFNKLSCFLSNFSCPFSIFSLSPVSRILSKLSVRLTSFSTL